MVFSVSMVPSKGLHNNICNIKALNQILKVRHFANCLHLQKLKPAPSGFFSFCCPVPCLKRSKKLWYGAFKHQFMFKSNSTYRQLSKAISPMGFFYAKDYGGKVLYFYSENYINYYPNNC